MILAFFRDALRILARRPWFWLAFGILHALAYDSFPRFLAALPLAPNLNAMRAATMDIVVLGIQLAVSSGCLMLALDQTKQEKVQAGRWFEGFFTGHILTLVAAVVVLAQRSLSAAVPPDPNLHLVSQYALVALVGSVVTLYQLLLCDLRGGIAALQSLPRALSGSVYPLLCLFSLGFSLALEAAKPAYGAAAVLLLPLWCLVHALLYRRMVEPKLRPQAAAQPNP